MAESTAVEQLSEAIQRLAEQRQGDCLALLALLRELEKRHQLIRETLFRDALPDNRQTLYKLLRDIEVSGGWPYIKRMPLIELLDYLGKSEGAVGETIDAAGSSSHDGQSLDQPRS